MQSCADTSFDYLLKIIVVGDEAVGKSVFLERFVNDAFTESYITTIGVDFKVKIIELNGKKVKLQIWDTAGQERFRNISQSYYRGSAGVIIMYDITNKKSFDNIEKYLEAIKTFGSSGISKVIVGNKKDLESKREVDKHMAMNKLFDPSEDIPLIECSAKDGSDVDKAFMTIAKEIIRHNYSTDQVSYNVAPTKLASGDSYTDRGEVKAYDDDSSAVDYNQLEEEALANKIYKGRSSYKKIMTMKKSELQKFLDSKKQLVERFSNIEKLPMDKEDDLRTLALMVNSLDIVG